ncbi:hypothetical protein R7X43_03330 [Mesomycoplasma ovipneumoniae]|nr:hypothetical protein [Mesomycoplasma ovipneumoniae]
MKNLEKLDTFLRLSYQTGKLGINFIWVSQFDGKNSLFSEYKYAKIPVNPGFLTLTS